MIGAEGATLGGNGLLQQWASPVVLLLPGVETAVGVQGFECYIVIGPESRTTVPVRYSSSTRFWRS